MQIKANNIFILKFNGCLDKRQENDEIKKVNFAGCNCPKKLIVLFSESYQ